MSASDFSGWFLIGKVTQRGTDYVELTDCCVSPGPGVGKVCPSFLLPDPQPEMGKRVIVTGEIEWDGDRTHPVTFNGETGWKYETFDD